MTSRGALAALLLDGPGSPDAPLVHVGERTRSRGEVADSARRLGEALSGAGVSEGMAVVALLPTAPGAVAAMFGVWAAGAVFAPVNPRLTDSEVREIVGDVRPAAVVGTAEQLARLDPGFPGLGRVEAGGDDLLEWAVRRGRETSATRHEPGVALVLYTSGTTGRPKAVLLRHDGVLEGIDAVLAKLGVRPAGGADAAVRSMPNLIPVSLSLWAGVYNTLFALRVGAPVVLLERADARDVAAAVRRYGLRSTVLPPAMITSLVESPDVDDLAPLRFVRSITAPLSPALARRFHERFGVSVLNSYGQTELGGEVVGWSAADAREFGAAKLGSVGRAHDAVEVRIVREGHGEVAAGETGEVWVRTPSMMAGYAREAPEEIRTRLSPDGFLRTGDLGHVDADGFLWLEGRVSDVINRGGLKVFPADVEDVILGDDTVREACVVGVPDERLGEVPWAFVVAARGHRPDPRRLEARCREALAPYKVPAGFEVVEELPRNEVGKVVRPALTSLFVREVASERHFAHKQGRG